MTITPLEKTEILIEALPYIKKYSGRTVVIKYGGHAMVDAELKKAVMQDAILMKYVGMHPVIVHGGGPAINDWLDKLGKQSDFVEGLRVTDAQTMEVAEMVLVGKVNKEIVGLVNKYGGQAVGLSGKDGSLLKARKQFATGSDGRPIDIGQVGEVTDVNPKIIKTVIENGYIPVVAPIGVGEDGASYNINADYVAGAIAGALEAEKLVLLTDVEGIFADNNDKKTLFSSIKTEEVPALVNDGIIKGGMVPKVRCCVQALEQGVNRTHIIDGRLPHSILLEIFTDEGIGTMVVKKEALS